jgi:RNA polymerase sigma-70 factor (ECF subfamily)
MFYRQQKRERTVSAVTSIYHELVDEDSINTDDAADQESLEHTLRSALQTLKPEELSLIELRFFEQRPFAEIAEILDITEANAKMRTYRILGRLRKKMPKKS